MVWREILAKTDSYLAGKGVPEPRTAAELLAARLLGAGRGSLAGALDLEPSERQLEAMRRGMARLAAGEPVQYVLGEWDFRRLTLKCDRRALIPRPETEELVTAALKYLDALPRDGSGRLVVDVGTGTGAIVLSMAKESSRGDCVFLGTDVSEDAVALARENAERCGLSDRVNFAVMDGLDDFDEPQCVDAIVSNPPYVETAACERLDPRIRDHEPRIALDGGADGLGFYDRYLTDAVNLLKPGGAVFFEIGDTQGDAVKKMMFDCGFDDIAVTKDFAGFDRYASAVLK
ncbi:MAG: peptide chain release factor N(5)-glutamine methyltransferase [Kiritimatiellae bacterium]|nr:peptide chain release factor N(5)-glutamine methyltransferase [Kiritimatiellia bacterium]